ncbi:LysR family transcriptional regulator [Bradyrhizobium guangdongense]|uniref:LysR substrate-binding domain-containing protein n=1 Tax=Bradyrhizobium guangdongense TaxID=1325090 RepID=UPI001126D9C0|nr:LysR substrate-binding domain-containing protein [Bradyrhizobium guangdongense]TPQ33322.1 LysR family transcriptional regulator [Bradyrhizobium guangdongense]
MHHLPPLTELRAFEAAARHLSFKGAAAELFVTPTAISHQIKLLERHCGRDLFRRRPRPLKLTAAGELLFPVVRDGLATFAKALDKVRASAVGGRLRITATNAFAARWLVPRLPKWRDAHPRLKLDIFGTDAILDLAADEADIAIRYARKPPAGGRCIELMRDTFRVVASPKLVGDLRKTLSPAELANFPLIEIEWPSRNRDAPTWQRWQTKAKLRFKRVPDLAGLPHLAFREELHAIEAAISAQGIAICSDVLIGPELASGALVQVSNLTLRGYSFFLVYLPTHPRVTPIMSFSEWARSMAR